jgi:hypothetical protein
LAVDGLDLWPTLTRGRPSPHDAILLNTTPGTGAVRAGDWKLVVTHGGGDDPDDPATTRKGRESVELFNLRDDPYEKTNRADREPGKQQELRRILAGFAHQAVPPKARPRPEDFASPKVWGEKD